MCGAHTGLAAADERRLIADEVQRVGHEDAVEIGKRPGRSDEVAAMSRDRHLVAEWRDPPQGPCIAIHRMDQTAGVEQLREGQGEGAGAAPEIGPRGRSEPADVTIGEHRDRVVRPHGRIIATCIAALPGSPGCCAANFARSAGICRSIYYQLDRLDAETGPSDGSRFRRRYARRTVFKLRQQ